MTRDGFGYKPALDGLRAFAVASVIGYHLGLRWLPGGFLGVDTFFVLSGFLITSLLLSEAQRSGRIELATFWVRRARRLLPAVLLVLVVVAIAGTAWLAGDALADLRGDGLATLFYAANWRFVASGQSYFDLYRAPSPLRHMWSLAIEEQFYVVWPLAVALVLRAARRGTQVLLLVAAISGVASAMVMAFVYDPADPSRAYYGTDTRAHGLLVGVALAIVLHDRAIDGRTRRAIALLAGPAFIAVLAAFVVVDDRDAALYRGGFVAFSLLVAVVVAAAVQDDRTVVTRLLATAPLRAIGRISYGLYLWHWPVIVLLGSARLGRRGGLLQVLQVTITVAAAVASYRLLEQPIRQGRLRGRRALVALAGGAAAVMVAMAAAGAAGTTSSTTAIPEIAADATLALPAVAVSSTTAAASATGPSPAEAPTAVPSAVTGTTRPPTTAPLTSAPLTSAPITTAPVPATAPTTAPTAPPGVTVPPETTAPSAATGLAEPVATIGLVGDSVAWSLAPALQTVGAQRGITVISAAAPGCPATGAFPLTDAGDPFAWSAKCVKNVARLQRTLVQDHGPQLVVWLSTWETVDVRVDGRHVVFGTPEGDAELLAAIDAARVRLTAEGARLVLLSVPPRAASAERGEPIATEQAKLAHLDGVLTAYAAEHTDQVVLVDFAAVVCPGGAPCPEQVDGVVVRPDGTHFSDESASWAAAKLLPLLVGPAATGPAG